MAKYECITGTTCICFGFNNHYKKDHEIAPYSPHKTVIIGCFFIYISPFIKVIALSVTFQDKEAILVKK
jgi:hypothetical protein